MELNSFDLVSSLYALPETEPVETDGIQFGVRTCNSACVVLTVNIVQTLCIGGTC